MRAKYLFVVVLVFATLLNNFASAQTWPQTSAANASWWAVASSADGSRLVATTTFGPVAASTNSGATWSATNDLTTRYWSSVARSADGVKLVAGYFDWVHQQGELSTSTNGGATWTRFPLK